MSERLYQLALTKVLEARNILLHRLARGDLAALLDEAIHELSEETIEEITMEVEDAKDDPGSTPAGDRDDQGSAGA